MEDIRFFTQVEYKIKNVGYKNVVRKKGFSFEFKEGKPNITFVYVEKGSMEYNFQNEKIKVDEGCVLFIPKKLPYKTVYCQDDTITKTITFNMEITQQDNWLLRPALKKGAIASVFGGITYLNMRNTSFLLAKAYELIYHLQLQSIDISKKYAKIEDAVKEITREYFKNHPVSYYASMCSMSESNLRKLFREYMGKSPIEYRNSLRIYEAEKLIQSGEYNVQEAAYSVGFNNMSFFYELYRKEKH